MLVFYRGEKEYPIKENLMIIALVILDRTQPFLHNNAPCFAKWPGPASADGADSSLLEQLVSTVLRGPFGGTIVALHPEPAEAAQEQLHGFAVHPFTIKNIAAGPHAAWSEGLAAAAAFRERWEKAMAAAQSRFKGAQTPGDHAPAKNTLAEHRANKDVKIRGLARSFDRDGVMLFRGDYPAMSLELQAQLVDAFGKESPVAAARPIAQAVHQGSRGYPVILNLDAAREVQALPPATDFDAWLLKNLSRVQDVNVEYWGAAAPLHSAGDYDDLCEKLKA